MARVKTATRTIVNGAPGQTLVLPATQKAVGNMPTESLVEYHGLLELIFDPDMVSLAVQPERVEIQLEGRTAKYTPDVRYVRRDGRIGYREFKHDLEALDADERAKLAAAAAYFRNSGYEFSVVEGKRLNSGYLIENIRLLKRYAIWPTTDLLQAKVLAAIEPEGTLTLHELRTLVSQQGYGALYRMLWEQVLVFDIEAVRLSADTRIRRGLQ